MPSWSDVMPPDRVDPDAFLFMGADPCWTPDRESKLPGHFDAPEGLCLLCGGDDYVPVDDAGNPYVDPRGHVVVVAVESAIEPGSHRVCGRCMKSGKPGDGSRGVQGVGPGDRASATLADSSRWEPAPDQPGFVTRNGVTIPERFARKAR
jgi:hypothetical protein